MPRLTLIGCRPLCSDVTLPDGRVVQNGMAFRNNFHVSRYSKATLFVPCGGRPESININNVDQLLGMHCHCVLLV